MINITYDAKTGATIVDNLPDIDSDFDVWYNAAKDIEETPKEPNLTLEELAEKMFMTQKQLETSQEALDFIIMEGM